MPDSIEYKIEKQISVNEFIEVLVDSSLGVRRPINDRERITKMLLNSNLIATARVEGLLIGVARSISDFSYCTYLSDLAVRISYQKNGVGKELVRRTKQASEPAKLILLSAPAAIEYYPRIGMSKHNYCFFLDNINDLK